MILKKGIGDHLRKSNPWENDIEYLEIIGDIHNHPFIKDLAQFKQHIYGNRLSHSYAVSYYSYKIAKRLRLDYRATARAGLMHDMFYYIPGEVSFSRGNHLTNHPKIALMNARAMTMLTEKEEDIIVKHMWLVTMALPKYRESYIVTMVDKYIALEECSLPLAKRGIRFVRNRFRRYRVN